MCVVDLETLSLLPSRFGPGLRHLSSLPKLRTLRIGGLTPGGLEPLLQLKQLEYVELQADLPAKDIASLLKSLNAHIIAAAPATPHLARFLSRNQTQR